MVILAWTIWWSESYVCRILHCGMRCKFDWSMSSPIGMYVNMTWILTSTCVLGYWCDTHRQASTCHGGLARMTMFDHRLHYDIYLDSHPDCTVHTNRSVLNSPLLVWTCILSSYHQFQIPSAVNHSYSWLTSKKVFRIRSPCVSVWIGGFQNNSFQCRGFFSSACLIFILLQILSFCLHTGKMRYRFPTCTVYIWFEQKNRFLFCVERLAESNISGVSFNGSKSYVCAWNYR